MTVFDTLNASTQPTFSSYSSQLLPNSAICLLCSFEAESRQSSRRRAGRELFTAQRLARFSAPPACLHALYTLSSHTTQRGEIIHIRPLRVSLLTKRIGALFGSLLANALSAKCTYALSGSLCVILIGVHNSDLCAFKLLNNPCIIRLGRGVKGGGEGREEGRGEEEWGVGVRGRED